MAIEAAVVGIIGLVVMALGILGVFRPNFLGLNRRGTARRIAVTGLLVASLGPILTRWLT